MRIVLTGKFNYLDLEEALCDALDRATDIIEQENPELLESMQKCESSPIVSAVIDVGFCNKKEDEPMILATDAGEVLTFRFNVGEDATVKLEGNNIEEPMFSDIDRAFVDLAEGLEEVPQTIDTTGLNVIYSTEVGGLHLTVYENGYAIYHKDGKLVQECTVAPDKLNDFLEEIQNIAGR